MSLLKLAYHEAGHALTARRFGRQVESVAIAPDGGAVRDEPFAPNASGEEIERSLVVTLAGEIAATYAPVGPFSPDARARADTNGGHDPYTIVTGMAALADVDLASTPSDGELVEHYRSRVGDEVVGRAERLAREFIERDAVLGRLELVADRLYLAGVLTGDDLEALLAAPA